MFDKAPKIARKDTTFIRVYSLADLANAKWPININEMMS